MDYYYRIPEEPQKELFSEKIARTFKRVLTSSLLLLVALFWLFIPVAFVSSLVSVIKENKANPRPTPTITARPTPRPTPTPTKPITIDPNIREYIIIDPYKTSPPTTTNKPKTEKNDANSITVYVTDTGSKYHKKGCQYLRQSSNPMSLEKARKRGYSACSRCW